MIRWTYVAPRLIAVLVVLGFVTWGVSPLLRWTLIRVGQSVTGAAVEIDSLEASLWSGSMHARDVAIADAARPERNLFEFRDGAIQLNLAELAGRRVQIDYARLRGVEWLGPRNESGALAEGAAARSGWRLRLEAQQRRWAQAGSDWLQQYSKWAGRSALRQLETVQLIEQLETRWSERLGQWKQRVKDYEARVERIRAMVETARKDPRRHLAEIQQVIAEAVAMRDELAQIRAEIESLQIELHRDGQALDRARQADLEKVRQAFQLAELDSRELGELMLGREMANRIEALMDWCAIVQNAVESAGEAPEPIRARGRDIPVWFAQPRPAFEARVLDLDGFATIGGNRVPFRARVRNISSEPQLTGPIVADAQMLTEFPARIRIKSDLSGPTARHDVIFSRPRNPLPKVDLGNGETFAMTIEQGEAQVWSRLQIEGKQVQGVLILRQDQLRVRPWLATRLTGGAASEAAGRLQAAVDRVADNLTTIQVRVDLGGTLDDPEWSFQTDLGDQLKAGLQEAYAAEAEWLRGEAVRRVDAQLAEYQGHVEQQFEAERAALTAHLQQWTGELDRWAEWKVDPAELLQRRTAERLREMNLELPFQF